MGFAIDLLIFCGLIFNLHSIAAQYERQITTNVTSQLKDIPRLFELRGETAKTEFRKYANEIETMTAGKNISVIYKVKVELIKPEQKLNRKKMFYKKIRSKKYNVPLKRTNMKLSNFEILLRKLAEENGQKVPKNYEVMTKLTTSRPEKLVSPKQIIFKYKPIIRKIRTNYTKVIKPVRNKLITITS